MPLFEVETEAHIIITWAADDDAATEVVNDAYPGERSDPHDQASARHLGHFQIGPGTYRPHRPLQHRSRMPLEGRRRQSPRHPALHARDGHRFGAGSQSHRVEHGHGLVRTAGDVPHDGG